MSKYIFKDKKDLNYVYKLGFVYKDKDGNLKRKDTYEIRNYYEDKYLGKGKYTKAQIYYMIQNADSDCDNYIILHKNDKEVELPQNKKGYKDMDKQEFINYLINSGYSDVDAEEKANCYFDSINKTFKDEKISKAKLNRNNIIIVDDVIEELGNGYGTLYKILEDNGKSLEIEMIGSLMVCGDGEIENITTSNKKYRGQGYSKYLIEMALKMGATYGISIDINEPSKNMFKRNGFKEIIFEDVPRFPVYVLPEKEQEVLNSKSFKNKMNYLKNSGNFIYEYNKKFVTGEY